MPTAAGRERMRDLLRRAEEASGRAEPWEVWRIKPSAQRSSSDAIFGVAVVVVAAFLLLCLVLGLLAVVRTVVGWF